MKSLDTYIQQKQKEFATEFSEAGDMHSDGCCVNSEAGCDGGTGILDCCNNMRFLNRVATSLIRITARETLEAVLPEEKESTNKNGRHIPLLPEEKTHNEVRTAILSAAKERGIL